MNRVSMNRIILRSNLPKMDWNALESLEDWNAALKASHVGPVVVFKHSTRCSISRMALKLAQRWDFQRRPTLLLDLLNTAQSAMQLQRT